MNFCSACGSSAIESRIPTGDNRKRYICKDCNTIFYQNPKNIVGCILEWEGKILLCKRSIEPRIGFWTIPSGFLEIGESVKAGAMREVREEACAETEALQLYSVYSLLHANQVYIIYRGTLKDGKASAGDETSAVGLYDEHNIDWSQVAFSVISDSLEHYFADRKKGLFNFYSGIVRPEAEGGVQREDDV